jgi:nucleotide-binding universal stress UspA family protein
MSGPEQVDAEQIDPGTHGKSVVLGLDTSPGARRALETAIRIARALDVPLVVVHGVEPAGRVGEEVGEAREAIEELEETVTRPAVAAAQAAGVRTIVEVVEDRPAPALVAVADEHDAEVIVVGIWNESPLRGLLLGSVAHKLLQLSDRPVLCVPGGDSLPRTNS